MTPLMRQVRTVLYPVSSGPHSDQVITIKIGSTDKQQNIYWWNYIGFGNN